MKKLILTTIITTAAVSVFAQGTVFFANDTATLPSPPDRFIRFGAGAAAGGATPGAAAYGTNIQVQLYYGTSGSAESALIPLSAGAARLRVSTSTAVGTWLGGTRTIQSAGPAAQLTLQIRAWDINYGASYEAAATNPNNAGFIGKSALFGYIVPQPTDPVAASYMNNFVSFSIDIVPEPSTFALAGLGAAAMLIFRRRK